MGYYRVEAGKDPPVRPPAVVVELIDEYVAYARRVRGLEEETVKEQRLYLGRFLATQPVSSRAKLFASLTSGCIRRFVFEYAEGHGPGSRQWMQMALRSFLRFCHHRGYLPCDLSGAVPAFRSRRLSSVPKAIDDRSIGLLLESLDGKSPLAVRDLAIIVLLLTYGVRGVQVRRLRLDDIDWAENQIRFQAVKRGKCVVQHLTPEVGNSLLAYIRDARPNESPYPEVFLTSRRPFHPFNWSGSLASIIASRLRRIGARLPDGVSHGTHSFRHAFASRLAGQVPLKDIADMLGQRDLSSVFIYSKVNFKALREAALPWPDEVNA